MNFEIALALLISVNLFLALTTDHVVWRCLGFKLAADLFAIFLMSFGGKDPGQDLKTLGIALIFTSTAILFLSLVVTYGNFREKKHEES